jgi:hypothetical protein
VILVWCLGAAPKERQLVATRVAVVELFLRSTLPPFRIIVIATDRLGYVDERQRHQVAFFDERYIGGQPLYAC